MKENVFDTGKCRMETRVLTRLIKREGRRKGRTNHAGDLIKLNRKVKRSFSYNRCLLLFFNYRICLRLNAVYFGQEKYRRQVVFF